MTGTNLYVNKCKQSRSYLNHLVYKAVLLVRTIHLRASYVSQKKKKTYLYIYEYVLLCVCMYVCIYVYTDTSTKLSTTKSNPRTVCHKETHSCHSVICALADN